MLGELMNKAWSMQGKKNDQSGNRERETPWIHQKEVLEINNTVKEMEHAWDGLTKVLAMTKWRIDDLDNCVNINLKKWKDRLRKYAHTVGNYNMYKYMYGNSGKRSREKKWKKHLKKISNENFPNLLSDTKAQNQKAQRIWSKVNAKNIRTRLIIFKLHRIKDIC